MMDVSLKFEKIYGKPPTQEELSQFLENKRKPLKWTREENHNNFNQEYKLDRLGIRQKYDNM